MAKLHRPHMPIAVKRAVIARQRAIGRQLGFGLDDKGEQIAACVCGFGEPHPLGKVYHLDHKPALGLRKYDPATRKYEPDANDPAYIDALTDICHGRKTYGQRHTKVGSDKTTMAKLDRLANTKVNKPPPGERRQPSPHWGKRGFHAYPVDTHGD